MKLRHIEVFHAVYLTGSTSGAARALNVSQPTISKVLKHAEDQLGFQLFDRTKGRLFPTEKGVKLFNEIEPIFGTINDLKTFSQKLARSKKGRLRVATTPAFGVEIAPKALAIFSKLHTDVTVEIETLHATEVIKALRDNTIDLGLVFDAPHAPGIISKVIGKTEFVCVAPADFDLPSKGTLHLKDLESSLMQGQYMTTFKGCENSNEVNIDRFDYLPSFGNPQTVEHTIEPWTRGGILTKELIRRLDYSDYCHMLGKARPY